MSIDDEALEQAARHQLGPANRTRAERREDRLRLVEQVPVDDGIVLALIDRALVIDLTDVKPVGEEAAQRALFEVLALDCIAETLAMLGL
jgi:hypothetical protein